MRWVKGFNCLVTNGNRIFGGKYAIVYSNVIVHDFPGGPVVKSLPANAGDLGSIRVLGRSHMLQSNLAQAPRLLSPCPRPHALQQQKPHNEKPVHCN